MTVQLFVLGHRDSSTGEIGAIHNRICFTNYHNDFVTCVVLHNFFLNFKLLKTSVTVFYQINTLYTLCLLISNTCLMPIDEGLNRDVHCSHHEGLRCRQLEPYPTGNRTIQCDKILQVMDVKGLFKSADDNSRF